MPYRENARVEESIAPLPIRLRFAKVAVTIGKVFLPIGLTMFGLLVLTIALPGNYYLGKEVALRLGAQPQALIHFDPTWWFYGLLISVPALTSYKLGKALVASLKG